MHLGLGLAQLNVLHARFPVEFGHLRLEHFILLKQYFSLGGGFDAVVGRLQYFLQLIKLDVEILNFDLQILIGLFVLFFVLILALLDLQLHVLDGDTLLRQHVRQQVNLFVFNRSKLIGLLNAHLGS